MKDRGKRGLEKEFKRKIIIASLFLTAIIINIFTYLVLPNIITNTGFGASSIGLVLFQLFSNEPYINITSPENITYNFTIGSPYILDLNVTYFEAQIDTWAYRLYDARHNVWATDWIAFAPNTTFNAVRWNNILYVNATQTAGPPDLYDNVSFFVFVNNSAPIIGQPIPDPLYVCEGQNFFLGINATDADENVLDGFISNISDPVVGNPQFAIFKIGTNTWGNTTFFNIISGALSKNSVGGLNSGSYIYRTSVSVVEFTPDSYSDTARVNITVIEINNPPNVVPNLGVQTLVWTQGVNSTLFEDFNATDSEFDNYGYGILNFSVNITNASTNIPVNLFGINALTGVINFTANSTTPLGVYDVFVCVDDTGLNTTHPQIVATCGQDGGSIRDCDYFELTITNQNRAPTIVAYNPTNLTFSASATNQIYFNVTSYDPDGTTPDVYWYVDNSLVEFDQGNLTEEFFYTFACGTSGIHFIKAEVTDGLLNDSVQWNSTIFNVDCSTPTGGGGGGGGGGLTCTSQWGCNPWSVCQNADISLGLGILSGVNYRTIQDECNARQITPERCGFQSRICDDFKACLIPNNFPDEAQFCLFIENPTCFDELRNCHDGECEVLIDCGGPCQTCPSCSDKIKNQREQGVDCGGPCPWACVPVVPFLKRTEVIYGFLLLLLLIAIFIVIKLIRIVKYKRKIDSTKKQTFK